MPNEAGGYPPRDQASPGESQATTTASGEYRSAIDITSAEAGGPATMPQEAAGRVASAAQGQGGRVAGEARRQAGKLVGEASTQVKEQAEEQKAKAAQGLRSLSKELQSMADGSDQSGLAADLAWQASQKSQEIADWLDRRDTGSLVEEVREFASRRPGTFLAGCVVAGVVAGRLTRGAVDAQRSDSSQEDEHLPARPTHAGSGGYESAAGSTVGDPLSDPLPTVREAGRTGGTYGVGERGRPDSTDESGETLR
jgi:hypothetical protein